MKKLLNWLKKKRGTKQELKCRSVGFIDFRSGEISGEAAFVTAVLSPSAQEFLTPVFKKHQPHRH